MRDHVELDDLAATWRANSSPMPEEAPVTSAQGPYVCLSICFMAPSFWTEQYTRTLAEDWTT